jgi:hypothetical protein
MVKTVALVLYESQDFTFRDVQLICIHLRNKWTLVKDELQIILFWNKASQPYDLGWVKIIPLKKDWPRWWSRMILYSPEVEQYRPFLYLDLDTAVINSIENVFNLVTDESKYITLEDFGQPKQLATPVVWFPKQSAKLDSVWNAWTKVQNTPPSRMDYFLRRVTRQDLFWQQITNTIIDFKPRSREFLQKVTKDTNLVLFHGQPRIFDAAKSISWVNDYIKFEL